MSLVLEALKKQEAGSDPDAAVSLARQANQRRRHRLWMGLFGVAMVANVAVVFWVFGLPWLRNMQDAPPATVSTPPDPADDAASPGAAPAADPPTTARNTPAPDPVDPPALGGSNPPTTAPATAPADSLRPALAAAAAATAAPPRARTHVLLGELPTSARSRFPGIAFSSHIYAEDRDLRAIVANGQRLTEGERIRGLEILEITESGVVLAFERYAVEVRIAGDWDT
jgi:hypothetical protein